MEKAFEDIFPMPDVSPEKLNVHLRYLAHIKSDILDYLKNKSVSFTEKGNIVMQILGSECIGKRTEGMVDCKDTAKFYAR